MLFQFFFKLITIFFCYLLFVTLSHSVTLENPCTLRCKLLNKFTKPHTVFPSCKNIIVEDDLTKTELLFAIRCISLVTRQTTKMLHGGGRSKFFAWESEYCPFHLHFVKKRKEGTWHLIEDDPSNSVCMTCNP